MSGIEIMEDLSREREEWARHEAVSQAITIHRYSKDLDAILRDAARIAEFVLGPQEETKQQAEIHRLSLLPKDGGDAA